ncbi:MAG: WD40 repeat domain-containing protein [Anaerolineae bacterium]
MTKQHLFSLCLCLMFSACVPTLAPLPPLPSATPPPPTPTLPPVLPDICTLSNNSYRLIRGDYATFATTAPTMPAPTAFDPPVYSPDGSYSVQRRDGDLYLRSSDGAVDTFLTAHAYDGFPMADYLHWSDDSQHIAIVEGTVYFSQALDIRVYEVNGTSTLLHAGLDHPSYLRGWSPNGNYLLGDTGLNQLTIWNWRTDSVTYMAGQFYVQEVAWSPDGEYIAYYGRDDTSTTLPPRWYYRIAAADGSQQAQFEVPVDDYYYGLGDGFSWSPDSQYVMYFYHQNSARALDPKLVVISRSGERLLEAARPYLMQEAVFRLLPVHWSGDSTQVLIWQAQEDGRYRLLSQPLGGGQAVEVLRDRLRLPYDAPRGRRTALYDLHDEEYSITLMDDDGANSVPFISAASDAGDPNWSADGQVVAAVWAAEDDGGRHVQLSWADASGGNRHDISGDYLDIRSLHWSPDSRALLYVGIMPDMEFRVELADVTTGEHQILLDGLSNAEFMEYDDERQLFTFVWHTADGEFGFAGYSSDGVQAFDLQHAYRLQEFPSPDGQHILEKGWAADAGESLRLNSADGETLSIVIDGLDGLGDPLWSPDGQMFAFTWWIRPGAVMLDVYNSEGLKLWSTEYSWSWSPLGWERC